MLFLIQALQSSLLNRRIYSTVRDTPEAMFRSLAVVMASGISFGLGVRAAPIPNSEVSPEFQMMLALSTMLIGWMIWTTVVYILSSFLLGGKASHRDLMRHLGLVYAPGILLIFYGLPTVGAWLTWIVNIWILAAGVVAVSEAQGQGLMRTISPTVIGWILGHIILQAFVFGPNSA